MPPPSKLAPEPALPPSTTLHEIHNTVHLLYHRNKNQHRCAKWFKQLSLLRRDTRKLALEVEEVERLEEEFDERVDEVRRRAGEMRAFLSREVVGRCYRAFSTVVADTQFSALGVVLIALLARLSKAIGAERYFPAGDAEGILPAEKMVTANTSTPKEDFGEVITRDQLSLITSAKPTPVGSGSDSAPRKKSRKRAAPAEKMDEEIEPAGVNTARGNRDAVKSAKVRSTASSAAFEKRKEAEEKKRKKKKRKGNAIDDIFGGL